MNAPVYRTLQNRHQAIDPDYILPDVSRVKVGEVFIVEYKKSGKIVRSEQFVCAAHFQNGEKRHYWKPVTSPASSQAP